MSASAVLAGMAITGGVLLIATGWRRRPTQPALWPRIEVPVDRVVPAVVAGAVALLLTRWLVAGAGAAAAAWVVGRWWRARSVVSAEARAEAIASWAEMLRDTVGTARGLEGVVMVTAPGAPAVIRPQVMAMAQRLQDGVGLDRALVRCAEDLDHPVGDLVITALRLTARSGGGRLREVLGDLAEVAHGEADVHRRLEVARARPRAQMRHVAFAIAGSVVLLTVAFRDYLAPYETLEGQLVLGGVGATVVAAAIWMERLGRVRHVQRYMRPEVSEQ